MNDKIRDLQRQIEREQELIKNCGHSFDEPFYNPEKTKEPIYEMRWQGVDHYHEIVGYRDKSTSRWTRKCSKCGYEQHTYETEPVITSHKPKFK